MQLSATKLCPHILACFVWTTKTRTITYKDYLYIVVIKWQPKQSWWLFYQMGNLLDIIDKITYIVVIIAWFLVLLGTMKFVL